MTERQEFVAFARQEGATITALCQQFGISRKTGYKWRERAKHGEMSLADHGRRPQTSPHATPPAVVAAVLAQLAAPSTITAILRRHGLLAPDPTARDFRRFEHDTPNALWQRDFMGHRALEQGRVHPLTVLDDHSSFAPALQARGDQQTATVRQVLTTVFQRYGLPQVILCDNGLPWGPAGERGLTRLEDWWLRLGIGRGLVGEPVAIRPTTEDGVWYVYFCQRQVAIIDRRIPEKV